MSSSLPNGPENEDTPSTNKDIDPLASLSDTAFDNEEQPHDDTEKPQATTSSPRPLRIYTRAQLLSLHSSPLVQPPPNMPELKSWFGTENEQNLAKKDTELSTPSGSRDRRFRRDYEDGETPSRPAFRSTLTQPSQMGNFKHQSLRDRDKDRERDGDKDRDIRDKEGQERLRHLSDKYDRDRMSIPSSNSRTKDRDSAPHLGSASSSRTSAQSQTATGTPRREPKDSSKRKVGESAEDWRRGANELGRTSREDRSDNGRREQDRERARSRPRDSSRSRPEPSSRRERGSERDDARERSTRDRERDDSRRDREGDREEDDTRHWRDDGKRDERIAARRAREKPTGDHWELGFERRWIPEDRDSRYKRSNGRDRRTGATQDETKEERKDREREKEKEPAWMDTYVPDEPLPGILGGKSDAGELDGIQAWKKGLKEKEKRGKDKSSPANTKDEEQTAPRTTDGEQQLDEIQLFRLMMQKEKEKKQSDPSPTATEPGSMPIQSISRASGKDVEPSRAEAPQATEKERSVTTVNSALEINSTLVPESNKGMATQNSIPLRDAPQDQRRLQEKTQFFESATTDTANHPEKASSETAAHFNPPPGSRLLAFGRATGKGPAASHSPVNPSTLNEVDVVQSQATARGEPQRSMPGFSPFEESRTSTINLMSLPDPSQRPQMDRSPLNQQFNPVALDSSAVDANGNGYAASKGSRFAKFFDGKGRDTAVTHAKSPTPIGFASASPTLGQRFDQGSFNGLHGNEERRTMDDLFAMLNNSQAHGGGHNLHLGAPGSVQQNHATFNGQNNLVVHQQLHHQLHSNRGESLYDSRLDDRSFVPDGMVPGLRTVLPPRGRDNFSDSIDDPILHLQRLAQQQQHLAHRGDPSFNGPLNSYGQVPRGMGLPLQQQQQQFRGGPSPNANQQHLPPSQRLPPGLANLGNRPPHEPSQFLGLSTIPTGASPLNALPNNGALQQQFNNYNNTNVPYGGPQFRSPLPSINLQPPSAHHLLSNIGQSNIDPRLLNQPFAPGLGTVQRGINNNSALPQQRVGPQLQGPPHLGMRHQQPPQIPPHMLPHLMSSNPQSQQAPSHQPQAAHDLMALLMGGSLRE